MPENVAIGDVAARRNSNEGSVPISNINEGDGSSNRKGFKKVSNAGRRRFNTFTTKIFSTGSSSAGDCGERENEVAVRQKKTNRENTKKISLPSKKSNSETRFTSEEGNRRCQRRLDQPETDLDRVSPAHLTMGNKQDETPIVTPKQRKGSILSSGGSNSSKSRVRKYLTLPRSWTKASPSERFVYTKNGGHKTSKSQSDGIVSWRDAVSAETFNNLTTEERKRQEVLQELYSSEQEYVRDLKLLLEVFVQPMNLLGLLDANEQRSLFGNISDIYECHKELLEKLLGCFDEKTHLIGCVGGVFNLGGKFREPYSEYCGNASQAKDVYNRVINDNSEVKGFLEICRDLPACRKLDLWSFLDQPRRRLGKYPLLLRQCLKYTGEGHIDYKDLKKGIQAVESDIEYINSFVGECDNYYRRHSLERNLNWGSFKPMDIVTDVKLVHSGKVGESGISASERIDGRERTSSGNLSSMYSEGSNAEADVKELFLFDDFLLVVKPCVKAHLKYKLIEKPMLLEKVMIFDTPNENVLGFCDGHPCKYCFQIIYDADTTIKSFYCFSQADKDQWIRLLRRTGTTAKIPDTIPG
eukprot:Nk52_evm34s250 gene=Nk52_evmTU34s250